MPKNAPDEIILLMVPNGQATEEVALLGVTAEEVMAMRLGRRLATDGMPIRTETMEGIRRVPLVTLEDLAALYPLPDAPPSAKAPTRPMRAVTPYPVPKRADDP